MTLTRTHLFGFVGLVALAFVLYWAKAEAQAVREKVLVLQEEVDTEAELTWVERPDRLEAAATRRLGLVPMTADRMATVDEIDQIAPLRALTSAPADPNAIASTDPVPKPSEPAADKPKSAAPKPASVATVVAR
jgi:hypothetical protein